MSAGNGKPARASARREQQRAIVERHAVGEQDTARLGIQRSRVGAAENLYVLRLIPIERMNVDTASAVRPLGADFTAEILLREWWPVIGIRSVAGDDDDAGGAVALAERLRCRGCGQAASQEQIVYHTLCTACALGHLFQLVACYLANQCTVWREPAQAQSRVVAAKAAERLRMRVAIAWNEAVTSACPCSIAGIAVTSACPCSIAGIRMARPVRARTPHCVFNAALTWS